MKLNKFIFKHFAPIPSKQWKQKIQYELQGANYQTELVHTNSDGISTLPYYTQNENNQVITVKLPATTKKAAHIIVTESVASNQKALKAIENGIEVIYFTIYSKEIKPQELLTNIGVPIIINTHFINVAFAEAFHKSYQGNSLTLITDPVGKLAQTGNWYRDTINDLEKLQRIISLNGNCLSINMSLFHNAGASQVQQLAYGLSQLIAYSKQISIHSCKSINYQVSVSTDVFIEVAKLKTLRILHNSLKESLNTDAECNIILLKSKRNLQAINSIQNTVFAETEQLIGFSGGVNIVSGLPENAFFFEEDTKDWAVQLDRFIHTNYTPQKLLFEENIYIEKLTQQLLTKTTELIDSMEHGGGFLVQFKKGVLNQKIKQKAILEQKEYKQNFEASVDAKELENKTPINYPFFKHEDKKTQYTPIIERRLAAPLEKPIWDTIYKHD